MKLNRKKIIAREFLILISCIVVAVFAFVGTYPYNYVVNSKIERLKNSINPLTEEIDSLEKPFTQKVNNQKWIFDEYKERADTEIYKDHSELWDRFEELQKADSIIFKWNNVWSKEQKGIIKEIGSKNGNDFNQFILKNSLSNENIKNKSTADSLRSEINKLESQIRNKEYQRLDFDDQVQFALLFLIIISIIAFLFRYLSYSIKWSIRTLKQKE